MERINVLEFDKLTEHNRIYTSNVVEVESRKFELLISNYHNYGNDYDTLLDHSKFVTNCTVEKDSKGIWITEFDDNLELINRMFDDSYIIETLFFGYMGDDNYVKEANLANLFLEVKGDKNPTKVFRKYKLMELDN